MQEVFTNKCLLRNFGNNVSPVLTEYNHIVHIGTITNIFGFFQAGAHKSLHPVNI